MRITKFVVSAAKMAKAAPLVRIQEKPDGYLFSENLVRALQENGCTNFVFEEVEQVD